MKTISKMVLGSSLVAALLPLMCCFCLLCYRSARDLVSWVQLLNGYILPNPF
ncbi:hypothetical protein [Flagellimonas flava]|uniref:hypothetical protein n=1 Tax=Flagellimonas flava TaxID=570519 RepID=UPI003D64C4E5